MATAEVPVKAITASAVVVQPGDTLIVAVAVDINDAGADVIKRHLSEQLPGVETIIIAPCSGLAVYKTDDNKQPSDAQIARWIKLNPGKFTAWIAKRDRIIGRLPGQQRG